MRAKNVKKYAAMALLLGLLQGCQDEMVIRERKPLEVSTYTVEQPLETQYRDFKGTVIPADLTPLAFRIEGELEAIPVRTGQKVKKGELLARLDDSKMRQQLADAQAQYELAIKQHKRGQDLIKKKMISQSELDELTANKRIAEVNYKVAKNNLEYTRLVAPFSGYVSEVPKESFESVNPGETIVSIYRDDVVRVRIAISDTVLATIDPDSRNRNISLKTTFSGDHKERYLSYYEHSSEPVEGGAAFEILMQMPQVEPPILPGASANMEVDLAAAGLSMMTGYQIPMTALDAGRKDGEFYIWKLVDGKTQKKAVNVTQIKEDGAIVPKGVIQGDVLVNSNLRRLREGAAVATAEKE